MPIIVPTTDADYLPAVADVAALLHARLREAGGNVPTSFTATTSPTATQVETFIAQEASMVLVDTGSLDASVLICSAADNVRQAVKTLIAKRAAGAIELSYWPDSVVNSGPSAADYWQQIVSVDQPAVVAAARECRLGDVVPGEEQQQATAPAYRFDTVRLPNSW